MSPDSVHASTASRMRNLYLAVNLRRVAFSDTSVGGEDVEEEILSLFKRREFTRDEPVSPYTINCGGSTVSRSLAERAVAGQWPAVVPSGSGTPMKPPQGGTGAERRFAEGSRQ